MWRWTVGWGYEKLMMYTPYACTLFYFAYIGIICPTSVLPGINFSTSYIFQQTKIRPRSGQVEMELGLRTRGPTYDRSKGEQIALNVDGAFREKRDSEDNFYKR